MSQTLVHNLGLGQGLDRLGEEEEGGSHFAYFLQKLRIFERHPV